MSSVDAEFNQFDRESIKIPAIVNIKYVTITIIPTTTLTSNARAIKTPITIPTAAVFKTVIAPPESDK